MFLTIIYNEEMKCLDITPDTWLRNFLEICIVQFSDLKNINVNRLQLFCNDNKIDIGRGSYERELQTFGIKDEDVIIIKLSTTTTSLQSPPNPLPSHNSTDVSSLISNLVKGIQAPTSSRASAVSSKEKEAATLATNIFQSLSDPNRLEALRGFAPELATAYDKDPTNFDAFLKAFKHNKEQQERKIKLMHDETSEEGQRYIAELIARENIDFTHQFAMEHMPEGAQVSILSESCAKRCEISRLIDERFRATARGVGGSQKFLGRIHSCQVQVEGHIFPCPFDVMSDRNIDILFGLNILRRHHCCIDLQKGVLRFGDGTEAEFLSEEVYRREAEAIENKDLEQTMEESKDKI